LISRESVRLAAPLLGAGLLTAFALSTVPFSASPLARPRTPFDRSASSSVAPGFALLTAARSVLPDDAALVTRTEPRNAVQETYYHRFALALLPGRRVLPAAAYGVFTPESAWSSARYVVVVGPRPASLPGALLLETPEGSVWRRSEP
jgi:hypothetical protein